MLDGAVKVVVNVHDPVMAGMLKHVVVDSMK
jgi:hypothetical protein